MTTIIRIAILAGVMLLATSVVRDLPAAGANAPAPEPYTADGSLAYPAEYRTWTFVTAGYDMSYSPNATPDHHMFDNVFADPTAYRAFQATGTWPDGTRLVLEQRAAQAKGSINVGGGFQTTDVMGVEVHVKDTKRFRGGWAFFAFDAVGKPGTLMPPGASCYACHSAHAAVDTTFVQFYPTLLPIAKAKHTIARD